MVLDRTERRWGVERRGIAAIRCLAAVRVWVRCWLRDRIPIESGRQLRIPAPDRCNVSYWNWYGFPAVYTANYILIEIVSFVLVGVIAALVLQSADW